MSKLVEFFKKVFGKDTDIDADVPELTAEDCMIFRANVPVVYVDSTIEQLQEEFRAKKSKFVLVCEDGIDEIIGICNIFKFNGNLPIVRQELSRPVFIAQSAELKSFCMDLLKNDVLYVVVDEFGGTKGVVTIESVLLTVFNILNDYNNGNSEELLINGTMPLVQFAKLTKLDLDIEDYDSKTVSGFIMEYLGKIPKANEVFSIGQIEFEILDIKNRQIHHIKIKTIKNKK
jgi:CBS domain containing-hemolysin-like protein